MILKSLIVSEERRRDEGSQLKSRKMNILMMRIMEEMTMMIMMILIEYFYMAVSYLMNMSFSILLMYFYYEQVMKM